MHCWKLDNDYVIVSFNGWNAEWNRRICNPREIRVEHCLIGESEETFPFSEQCLRFKKTDFYF